LGFFVAVGRFAIKKRDFLMAKSDILIEMTKRHQAGYFLAQITLIALSFVEWAYPGIKKMITFAFLI
jgi:hypothetical protein